MSDIAENLDAMPEKTEMNGDCELFEITRRFNSLNLLERHVLPGNDQSLQSLPPAWVPAGSPAQIVIHDMRIDKQALAQQVIQLGLAYRVSIEFARSHEYLSIALSDIYLGTLDRLAPKF